MKFEKVIVAWKEASEKLKIKIQWPFILIDEEWNNIEYDLLIENFGTKLGTLITSTDNMKKVEKKFKLASQYDYYCSALNPTNYSKYNEESFIDTLNDWGYYGDKANKPAWLE